MNPRAQENDLNDLLPSATVPESMTISKYDLGEKEVEQCDVSVAKGFLTDGFLAFCYWKGGLVSRHCCFLLVA